MPLSYAQNDQLNRSAGAGHHPMKRILKRVHSALRTLHRAIAAAKIRRIRNELMLNGGAYRWT